MNELAKTKSKNNLPGKTSTKHLYAPKTAGRLMVSAREMPVVSPRETFAEIRHRLIVESERYVNLNYIYVTDREHHLIGVFSIKEFFHHLKKDGQRTAAAIMEKKLVSVRQNTHQERVALLALKHSIKAMPVTDQRGVLLGVVPFDVILEILDQEAVEDFLAMGGVYHRGEIDNLLRTPIKLSIKHRLPWLILGLLGGLFAAGIIGGFEELLAKHLILAAFIPLIVYMAGAVSAQTVTFIIRDLALNPAMKFIKYFTKQLTVVSVIGVIVAGLLWFITFVLYGNLALSFVLGSALFFAIVSSVFSGLVVPYLFSKFKSDPANASGPMATIIQDVLSIVIYFVVASLVL